MGKSRPGYRRPRSAEPRRVRRVHLIDKLPVEVQDRILQERASGRSWEEIEKLSEKFAGRRLPHSSLQLWYDVRYQQVIAEEQRLQKARAATLNGLLGRGYQDVPASIRNKLADRIADLSLLSGPQNAEKFEKSLIDIGWLLQGQGMVELKKEAIKLEREKLERLQAGGQKLRDEIAAGKLKDPKELVAKLDSLLGRG